MTKQERENVFSESLIDIVDAKLIEMKESQEYLTEHLNDIRDNSFYSKDDDMKKTLDSLYAITEMKIKHLRRDIKRWENLLKKEDPKYAPINLDRIKEIPILQFLEDQSPRIKNHYMAPWRTETKPSLVIYPSQNRWYDFGECTGGTVIDFIMKLNGWDFRSAVIYLQAYV